MRCNIWLSCCIMLLDKADSTSLEAQVHSLGFWPCWICVSMLVEHESACFGTADVPDRLLSPYVHNSIWSYDFRPASLMLPLMHLVEQRVQFLDWFEARFKLNENLAVTMYAFAICYMQLSECQKILALFTVDKALVRCFGAFLPF